MSQDRFLGKLSSIFKEIIFRKCKFLAGIQVFDAWYKHAEKQIIICSILLLAKLTIY